MWLSAIGTLADATTVHVDSFRVSVEIISPAKHDDAVAWLRAVACRETLTNNWVDRLVTACYNGDVASVEAAVADGASVNTKGRGSPFSANCLPLRMAVSMEHHDVVVSLLSHGADPNGDFVMCNGVLIRSPDILQLVIDAGGDVNRDSGGRPLLFWAIQSSWSSTSSSACGA